MTSKNLRTALFPVHLSLRARMVPFGGWDMPVQYSGILSEVAAARTSMGVFDVSHMGRLYISGPKATELLDWVLTGSAETLRVGRARYCMVCNEKGGVIDDTILYRLSEDRYLLIPNAGNRTAVAAWLHRWINERYSGQCFIEDRTASTSLIAFQGPRTPEELGRLCILAGGGAPVTLRPFAWGEGLLGSKPVFIGRTGYTGEDGFEIVADSEDAEGVWRALLDCGAVPCGLGARDVLRLEAGLPLHGHELDENITPIEAGLERFVRFDKEYSGSAVLKEQRRIGVLRRLVGLKLPGRSAPRAGYPIFDRGHEIGRITSGSYSPTLDTSIAMGYVLVRYATPGQAVEVDIRGRATQAEVVPLPFYSRPRRSETN